MVYKWLGAAICAGFMLWSCGGGNGLGPDEIKKKEDRLRDRLVADWALYNQGDYDGAIASFVETLKQADLLEDAETQKKEIKAEAQNGIGWSYFRKQDLDAAGVAFASSTRLDRRNADPWVGWAGVALANQEYNDTVQFAIQALEANLDYKSAVRIDQEGRSYSHDDLDKRHVRLMQAEAYFNLGRYTVTDRPDPNNATAQVRLIQGNYVYVDPGQLLETISQLANQFQQQGPVGAMSRASRRLYLGGLGWRVLFCLVAAMASPVSAQQIDLLRQPTNSAHGLSLGQGLDRIVSAEPLGKGRFRVRLLNRSIPIEIEGLGTGSSYTGHYGGVYGLANGLDLGFMVPFYFDKVAGLKQIRQR